MNDSEQDRFNQIARIATSMYIFRRASSFYFMNLKDDAAAIANAELNPGTVKVERFDGTVVWQDGSEN